VAEPGTAAFLSERPLQVIAAGKAAPDMVLALDRLAAGRARGGLVVSTHLPAGLPLGFDGMVGGHPTPSPASMAAGRRALEIARHSAVDHLVVLLSGGASALLVVPVEGVSLDDKRRTTARLLTEGASIHALNTVRKHLSRIKGGWLAATAEVPSLTLAVSDVVDDDLSVIGSGPTVADPTTFGDALAVLDRFGGRAGYPRTVVGWLERGAAGEVPETPKRGDPRLARAAARIIASRADALGGARAAAESRGYHVVVHEDAVVGEAREAARRHFDRVVELARRPERSVCLLSGGETTVRVTGQGRGGRNQEFAVAMALWLPRVGRAAVCASLGTDGIDGPTDAAGGLTDSTTLSRARATGIGGPQTYLECNDSHSFLSAVGDLVVTGPTGTNVGDVQIVLIGDGPV